MNIEKLTSEVLAVLLQNGWYEGRIVDTTDWMEALLREGYVYMPEAEAVLRRLGGLHINMKGEVANFDVIGAASGESDRFPEWEEYVGTRLFPLGETGPHLIMMGEDGRWFIGERPGGLWLIGGSIEEALHNLFVDEIAIKQI